MSEPTSVFWGCLTTTSRAIPTFPCPLPVAAFFIVRPEPNRHRVASLVILLLLTLMTIIFFLLKRRPN